MIPTNYFLMIHSLIQNYIFIVLYDNLKGSINNIKHLYSIFLQKHYKLIIKRNINVIIHNLTFFKASYQTSRHSCFVSQL